MAFEELYNNYVNVVYSYLKFKIKDKHLLEDILQDTFISIYKDSDKLGDVKNIKAYILKIAHNRMVDALRKVKVETVNIDDLNKEIGYEESAFDSLFISELFQGLDEISRDIVYGIYVENLTYKEMAEILNLPEGTVKSKCYYAKKKLKNHLKEVV